MTNWLIGRFSEPSTYAGLFAMASAFLSVDFTVAQQAAIVMLGTGLFVTKG